MMSDAEQNESQNRAASEAAGRNDPLRASGIAPKGQVGLNMAIEWAGRFGQLALDMERNSRKWRSLAEDYLAALKELQASVQELKKNVYGMLRHELEQKLLNLELNLAMVIEGDSRRAAYAEAVQEAEELSKRRSEAVDRFLDFCSSLRRRKA